METISLRALLDRLPAAWGTLARPADVHDLEVLFPQFTARSAVGGFGHSFLPGTPTLRQGQGCVPDLGGTGCFPVTLTSIEGGGNAREPRVL